MKTSKLAVSAVLISVSIFSATIASQARTHHRRHAPAQAHYGDRYSRVYAGGHNFRGRTVNNPGFARAGDRAYCENDLRAGCTVRPYWFQQSPR